MTVKQTLFAITRLPVPSLVNSSLAYVASKRSVLKSYREFDIFIDRVEDDDPTLAKGLFHHLTAIRQNVLGQLWEHQVFIGADVIDRLLFDAFCDEACADPRRQVFEIILQSGLHRPGFVLYPLHSFGVQGYGLLRAFRKGVESHFTIPKAGVAVTAQTNSVRGTLAFLEAARKELGIVGRVPERDIEHIEANPVLKWITHNPLMMIRVASFNGSYYQNQRIYMLKLRLAGALLMILSVLADRLDSDSRLELGSSRRINNWQTLDIKHYLTFERVPHHKRKLNALRVPMNSQPLELALLSDLNVDVDPRAWRTNKATKTVARFAQILRGVEDGYRKHVLLKRGAVVYGRVYRKIVSSIEYFRRSFSAISKHSEATVSLAVAFESLLVDNFAPGITEEVHRRVAHCLIGIPGVRAMRQAVRALFKARGEIVHLGVASANLDLFEARRAYAHCLAFMAKRAARVPPGSDAPMRAILDL